jgi:hypothetical protein
MLPYQYRQMLKVASESGEAVRIENAIQLVKRLVPQYFFGDDKDPSLKTRVFYHQPYSSHWSGTSITSKRIPIGRNHEY